METKANKVICKVVHSLANLFILGFIFFFAFMGVCSALSTLIDFSVWTLIITFVSTFLWVYLLKFYKEDKK